MALQSTTALATVTLQAATPTVTFSGIPNTYRDLILVINGKLTANNIDINIALNSDTTVSNYSRVVMSGTTSSTTSSFTSDPRKITGWGYWGNDQPATVTVQFMDYSATDKHKTFLTRAGRASSGLDAMASRYASLTAISSISLTPVSNFFDIGSTFSLYGRIA
jgi:hypothetical protein